MSARVVLNLESELDVRTQLGNANAPGRNNRVVQQPDEILFAAAQTEGEDLSVSKQQWAQTEPARGTWLTTVFATPEGELYVVDGDLNMHKLSADGKEMATYFRRDAVIGYPLGCKISCRKVERYLLCCSI